MILPGITAPQMAEVDRIMVEELHIPVELMMEHAGLNLARIAVQYLKIKQRKLPILIVAGSGNNGGGGLVAARRLYNWGYHVNVWIPRSIKILRTIPKKQLQRLQALKKVHIFEEFKEELMELQPNWLILDAYLGYNFKMREDPITDNVFEILRKYTNIISLDVPSGLDLENGISHSKITPKITLTLAFVKQALLFSNQSHIGELYIADIGIPIDLYKTRLGIQWTPPFHPSSLDHLAEKFASSSLHQVKIVFDDDYDVKGWKI